jgi:hypothetical protein
MAVNEALGVDVRREINVIALLPAGTSAPTIAAAP